MSQPEPLTEQQLDEYAQLIARTTPFGAAVASPGMSAALLAEICRQRTELAAVEVLAPQQCPAGLHADWLVDSEYAHACPWCQIEKLRADAAQKAEEFRALFGNLTVKGRDGDWANVADFIATGARIPACDAFYPHHTDTRCHLAKGHRRNHLAKWGTGDMAWPYDPRETQQPLAVAEVSAGTAAPAPPVAPLAASQPSEAHGEGETAARAATGRTGDPGAAVAREETRIVADDSDDPEHTDDCPGCDATDCQPPPAV